MPTVSINNRSMDIRYQELFGLLTQNFPSKDEHFWAFKNASIDSVLDSFCALYEDCRGMGASAPLHVKEFVSKCNS